MSSSPELPIVAIVGRPNVGKSTLFNRFAGHRRAVVENQPGITRDRIVEEAEVAGRSVLIVDTAGLETEADEGLPAAIQGQAWAAIEDADAILFVVDSQSGILPDDEELARTLRRTDKPVSVVVNKIDVPAHRDRLTEFYGLGLDRTRAVSAEHGGGAWDALEELVAAVALGGPRSNRNRRKAACASPLVGRPNVGKSSLVNRLARWRTAWWCRTLPGTTRDATDVRLDRARSARCFTIVDTAGLRRVGRTS